jgi:internalin A
MKYFESGIPDLWNENSLRPYLGEVKRRHGVVETLALPSMRDLPPVQIETLFVPPLLAQSTVSADTDPDIWPAGRALLSEMQDFRQLVVLGDPGGGKTTLSNWLAWRLAAGLNSPLPPALNNRVPIPCVLREMPVSLFNADISLIDLAHSVAEKLLGARTNDSLKEALTVRVNCGAYVLILDGVDEIPLNHRQVVAGWIRAASEQGGCVLATSRIVGYEDAPVDGAEGLTLPSTNIKFSDKKFDAKYTADVSYIGFQQKLSSAFRTVENLELKEPVKWAHIRYLMPFDQGRIASFAENWYRQRCMTQQEAAQKTTDLLAALSQSEVTQKLARTPNLLSLMAIVHRERAHLPDGKALLYEEIVNAYINTIDKQRKIEPGDTLAQYGWKDRKAWLSYVGFKMQLTRGTESNRDAGILADEAEVEKWLTEAMLVSGVPLPDQAAKTFLNWVARRSGLLLPRGEARYAFVHLSFQEYFCACYLDSCIVRPAFIRNALSDDADVTKSKLASWSSERHWFETLVFLFELLSAERDSEWVDDLVRIIFGEEISEFAPYDRAGELASRIIKNKHIKISSHYRDSLAIGLGPVAINIWEGERYGPDSGILASLIDAGYAAVIGSVSEDKGDSRSLQGKCLTRIDEVVDPGFIRILIIEKNIVNSQSLECFNNVMYLRMKDVEIDDNSFLMSMKGLRVLQLISLPISDINTLVELVGLTHLELHNMRISDLTPLSRLKSIDTLELHSLAVSDLSPISNLKKIVYLSLQGLQVDNIAPVSTLKSLVTLYLDGLPLVDVSPISSLKNLSYLKLDSTPVSEFKFLKGLKRLANLDLRRMIIPDLTEVANIRWLSSLYMIACDVVSLSPLEKLVELRGIGLMYLSVSDVSFISKLKKLTTCYITGVELSDLAPFASLKNLITLSIESEYVPSLEPLAKCQGLRYLDIDCKSSVDVLPLKRLKLLHDIQIKSSKVENLQAFEGLESVNLHWEEQL